MDRSPGEQLPGWVGSSRLVISPESVRGRSLAYGSSRRGLAPSSGVALRCCTLSGVWYRRLLLSTRSAPRVFTFQVIGCGRASEILFIADVDVIWMGRQWKMWREEGR